jgi:DNA-binding transcriptional LysR family regulator
MGRSQPTISRQVKWLEQQFGPPLLDRSGPKVTLTPEGRIIFDKTIAIFELVKEMKGVLSRTLLQLEGEVSIATTHAINQNFLPAYDLRFLKQYPMVVFNLQGGGKDIILSNVKFGESDCRIIDSKSISDEFVYHDLFETTPVLIKKKAWRIPIDTPPSLTQIASAPFIGHPKTSTLTPWIEELFTGAALKLNTIMIINNYDIVKRFVASGAGVSILDDYTITEEDKDTLGVFTLEEYFPPRKFGIIFRKRKYLAPALRAFHLSLKTDILFGTDIV